MNFKESAFCTCAHTLSLALYRSTTLLKFTEVKDKISYNE